MDKCVDTDMAGYGHDPKKRKEMITARRSLLGRRAVRRSEPSMVRKGPP